MGYLTGLNLEHGENMYHIFIVDDDNSFRRSLAIQLEMEGYQISEAGSAKEALNSLDHLKSRHDFPDLVMTDILMPEVRGTEFASELHQRYKNLAVCMMSAYGKPEETAHYPFFKKPFKVQQVVDYIKTLEP